MNLTRGQESSALCAAENRLSYAGWRVAAVCHIGVLTGLPNAIFIYSFSFMVNWFSTNSDGITNKLHALSALQRSR